MTTGNIAKHLVIQILIQDMKHQQLIAGLHKLGFQSDVHGSDLCSVVAELMGIPAEQMSWEWLDCYMDFLGQAGDHTITGDGSSILPLAENCYIALSMWADSSQSKRTE